MAPGCSPKGSPILPYMAAGWKSSQHVIDQHLLKSRLTLILTGPMAQGPKLYRRTFCVRNVDRSRSLPNR